MALHRRLLQDFAEIQEKPYPNIRFIPHDQDITKACLILTPDGYAPLHLTILFGHDYPLRAPRVTIQSRIDHPNVFSDYICATILNTTEGWTSAYTLKGICIQLLSFFGSDSLDQDHGGGVVDLTQYKGLDRIVYPYNNYTCSHCNYVNTYDQEKALPRPPPPGADPVTKPSSKKRRRRPAARSNAADIHASSSRAVGDYAAITSVSAPRITINHLPDELLVLICSHLEPEELAPFSRAWNRIGTENGVVTRFNIIRNRELICFTLKRNFEELDLGVGVHIEKKGRLGSFESEFDLLSEEAFSKHLVRRAVQGNTFEHWLPLPISRRHHDRIKNQIEPSLKMLSDAADFPIYSSENVIYGFMSDIVVRLSQAADDIIKPKPAPRRYSAYDSDGEEIPPPPASSLTHASEKAIESYYHLFHLLLCLATSNPSVISTATRTIKSFKDGLTSKHHVPNLGHLLIAVLISNVAMDVTLLRAIIKEAITRNVVWMLDARGANKPELSFMESNAISEYRLQQTFDASLTSYRLLMFQNLSRRTINRGGPKDEDLKPLSQLRDELFDSHGAPPLGMAARLAADVKRLQGIKTFAEFLTEMGVPRPSKSQFTALLRQTVEDSMEKGYSVWGISQEKAYEMRRQVEADVERGDRVDGRGLGSGQWGSFFPGGERGGRGGGRGGGFSRGGRGGRGRGRA